MGRKTLVIFVLLALVIIAAALWARSNMYYETVETKVRPSIESLRNSYLAMGRLLDTQGISTEKKISAGLQNALRGIDGEALWITDIHGIKTDAEFAQLLQWVKKGGHLIVEVSSLPYDNTDPFYKALDSQGIEIVLYDDEYYPDPSIYDISIPLANSSGESIRVGMYHRQIFHTNKTARIQIGDNFVGSRLLQVGVEAGFITLLSDAQMFSNDSIEYEDNAYFLLWLLNANPDLKTVSILEDLRDTPGLFSTLFSRFTLAMFALLAVLAAYLLRVSSRLGPILKEPVPGGKNLISHLRARGFFLARQRKLGPMLLPVRGAASQAISRRKGERRLHAEPANAIDSDTIKLAARLADCTPEKAQRALSGDMKSTTDLVDSSIVLHRILHPQQGAAASDSQTNTKGSASS